MKKGKRLPLESVCNVEYGTRVIQKRDSGSVYPVYGGGGATFNMDSFNREDRLVVARFGISEECTRFVAGKFFLNDSGLTVSPKSAGLEQRFLDYHLLALNDEIYALGKGTAQKNLDVPLFRLLNIFVPDTLSEQRRIVGVLDEAFAGLATAQAHAAQNLQNARALFESHLQSVFTHHGPGRVEKKLGELCEVFEDGDWVESKDQSSEGIRLIQTGNVGEGVFKDRAEKARYISEATFKRLRCTEIFEGDCLISRLPDPVGRSCILPDTGERMITAVDCTIVRFKRAQLLPALFNLYSQSSDYIGAVAKQCTGTTRNRISRSNLGLIPIPVPPLAEQREIVTQLDALAAETQRLTRLYEQKQAALAALKKSLLHQAFTGEL